MSVGCGLAAVRNASRWGSFAQIPHTGPHIQYSPGARRTVKSAPRCALAFFGATPIPLGQPFAVANHAGEGGLRALALFRRTSLLVAFLCLASCASVSTSDVRTYALTHSELQVSARAERGFGADQLVIVIDGTDVADGPFGPAEAAGTVLQGTFNEMPVTARCGHRWRPGIHIGYRCFVQVDGGDPIQLDF